MRAASVRRDVVDDVAAERRQLDVADASRWRDERGLANWPAMRPTFTTGTPERVGEHDRHLQDDLQLLADGVGGEVVEATRRSRRPGAGRPCRRRPGRATRLQGAGLAGEHQRRVARRSASAPGRARRRRATRAAARPGGRCHDDGVQVATGDQRNGASTVRTGEVDRTRSVRPGDRGDPTMRRGRAVGQAASGCGSASSRRPSTARLTRRRAASAVTPSSSPTSRKLLRSPSMQAEAGLDGVAGPVVERAEQLVEQLAVDHASSRRPRACRRRRPSGRRAWRRRRRRRSCRARPGW